MRPSGSPAELERRRRRAIAFLQQGMAPVDVARHVGVDRRSVRRWRASHDRAGSAGVDAKPAPGRPPKLDARRRVRLERLLLRGAAAAAFATPPWTCPRVADMVRAASSACAITSTILVGCSGHRLESPET
jgi:transposase